MCCFECVTSITALNDARLSPSLLIISTSWLSGFVKLLGEDWVSCVVFVVIRHPIFNRPYVQIPRRHTVYSLRLTKSNCSNLESLIFRQVALYDVIYCTIVLPRDRLIRKAFKHDQIRCIRIAQNCIILLH